MRKPHHWTRTDVAPVPFVNGMGPTAVELVAGVIDQIERAGPVMRRPPAPTRTVRETLASSCERACSGANSGRYQSALQDAGSDQDRRGNNHHDDHGRKG